MQQLFLLKTLFSSREKRRFFGIILLMLIGSILEVCGIGLIFPFIAIMQNPDLIQKQNVIRMTYEWGGFSSEKAFFITVGVLLLSVFLVKNFYSIFLSKLQMRLVYDKQTELGRRLLSSYLYRPYSFYLKTNSAVLVSNLTTALNQVCGGMLQSSLTLFTEACVVLGVFAFLCIVKPFVAMAATVLIGIAGYLSVKAIKAKLQYYGKLNDSFWKQMIKTINQSIGAVKEVQILGRQHFFIEQYVEQCLGYSNALMKYNNTNQLPRVFIESGAIGGMILFIVIMLISGKSPATFIPLLALFAVATVRLLPSLNRIVIAYNTIVYHATALKIIHSELGQANAMVPCSPEVAERLLFQKHLAVQNLAFTYPEQLRAAIDRVEFSLLQGESIAFIGHSGSGKTTLIDIILGLHDGYTGLILVDGVDVRNNLSAWRSNIGYIPQQIYLSDDTIKKNIAYGIPENLINIEQIRTVCRMAELEGLVQSSPEGLETIVGDKGVRLSGGERQRIGIARALYHDPQILILDEATSALDNQTEQKIVAAINKLRPSKSLIIIAHRLTTVKDCDRLYLMRKGRIVDSGSFDDLAALHPEFVSGKRSDPSGRSSDLIEESGLHSAN